MEIPRYIDEALKERAYYADMLMDQCCIVDKFILENGLDSVLEDYDYLTGCEIYVNPYNSEKRIREAIENFEKKDT